MEDTKNFTYNEIKFINFPEFAEDLHNYGQKYVKILERVKIVLIKIPHLKSIT